MTGLMNAGVPAVAQSLIKLPRHIKRLIMIGADTLMIPTCLWVALILKFDRVAGFWGSLDLFIAAVVIALITFSLFGLYRAVIRYMGPKAMANVVMAVTLSVDPARRLRPHRRIAAAVLGVRHVLGGCAPLRGRQPLPRALSVSSTAPMAARPSASPSTARARPARSSRRCCSAGPTSSPSPSSTTSARCRATRSTASRCSARRRCPS